MYTHSRPVYPLRVAIERIRGIVTSRRDTGAVPLIYLPGNAGRISTVEDWLFQNAEILTGGKPLHVFQTLALGPASGWADAVVQGIIPVTPFIGPGVRPLVNKGLARNIRVNLSRVHKLYENHWRPDVAFAHVSPPDNSGRVTLGLNAGLDISAVKSAKFKIAVVNHAMPRWAIGKHLDLPSRKTIVCGCAMHLNDFDLVIKIDEALYEHAMVPKEEGQEIAASIANKIISVLTRDADEIGNLPHTLQLGIGTIPNALAAALAKRGRSVEAIWSEMFSDGVLQLYKKGLIRRTNERGLRGHVVVGFVLGSLELYKTMQENPDFAVLPQETVNDPAMIAHNQYMASINATLAVSLHGEVAASSIGLKYHSDVGGQNDFALGASWSKGGVAVIALPSTVVLKDGSTQSRVVATHEEGAHHTISADLPVVVVTEHGVADLREHDDTARVNAMLQIAHPDWREALAKEARQLPAMQGVGVIPPRMVQLRGGTKVVFRPATSLDIPEIKNYIRALSAPDRYTRYMGHIHPDALTADTRLERLYHHTLDYEDHAAFIAEDHGAIIGVVHAFQDSKPHHYEISFSRRSDREREGIGEHLMCILIDWATCVQAEELHAVTYRTKNPRMRRLFEKFGFSFTDDPNERANVIYSGRITELVRTRERMTDI